MGVEGQDPLPGQVVMIQPGGQRRRQGAAPVGGAHKDDGIGPRRMENGEQPGADMPLNLFSGLGEQFREGRGIGLPGVDLAPVAAGDLLQGLRHPVGVPGVRVGDDQEPGFVRVVHGLSPPSKRRGRFMPAALFRRTCTCPEPPRSSDTHRWASRRAPASGPDSRSSPRRSGHSPRRR